jgi:phosphate transport system substrate-binding protein
MKTTYSKAFSVVLLGAFILTSCGGGGKKLVIKGSDTLGAKLVPQLAETYKADNPHVTFEIAAEGSSTGLAALASGATDIAMSSRPAKSSEITAAAARGIKMSPTIAAYDGIAIIVNENNPINELSLEQIEKIFTGDVRDWSAIGGQSGTISIYTRNTASGTYSDFTKLAMSKRDYAPTSQKMAGNEQIASEVGRNINGIGYIGLAYMGAEGIKIVAVEGVKPSEATIQDKSYAIARPTYYYTDGEPYGETAKFLEFAIGSSQAHRVMRQVGFVPPGASTKTASTQ